MENAPDAKKPKGEQMPSDAADAGIVSAEVHATQEDAVEYKPNFVMVDDEKTPESSSESNVERDIIDTSSNGEEVMWPKYDTNLPVAQMTPLEQRQHLKKLTEEVQKLQDPSSEDRSEYKPNFVMVDDEKAPEPPPMPEAAPGAESPTPPERNVINVATKVGQERIDEIVAEAYSAQAQRGAETIAGRLAELGKQGGEFVQKAGVWYQKLPFKYKLGVSAALIAASVVTGGGSLATLVGAAQLGQRALASSSVYALVGGVMEKRIAAREEKEGVMRTKYDTWKKHGYATASAVAVFAGIPMLHHFFSGAGSSSALSHLHETITGGHASSAIDAHTAAAPGISVEVQPGRGYEQMAWDMHKALHAPGAHFDPKSLVPGSDLEKIWNASGDDLKGVVHRLAIEHGFTAPGAVISEHAHMTFDEHGSLVVSQGEHGAAFADISHASAASHAPIPEPRPEHLASAPVETHAAAPVDHHAPTDKTNFSGRTGERMPYGKDAGAGAHIPYQNAMNPEHVSQPASVVPAPEHAAEAATQHAPVAEAGEHFVVNAHGLTIDAAHAHIYTDAPNGQGTGIVYGGGRVEDRVIAATKWIAQDHSRTLYFDSTKPGIMQSLGLTPRTEITKAVWDESEKAVRFITSAMDSSLKGMNLPSADDLASQIDLGK